MKHFDPNGWIGEKSQEDSVRFYDSSDSASSRWDRLLDGRSLRSHIDASDTPDVFHAVLGPTGSATVMGRSEGTLETGLNGRDARLQLVSDEERLFLSDLDAVITERVNLAHRYPDGVTRLTAKHEALLNAEAHSATTPPAHALFAYNNQLRK
jgi:hypothetical protein